ncbi:MAG: hypothetical protein IPJ31_03090 [Bacteroidetes bacterium]|nr:hypothetical protein [Bacteroidota bacterium]
MRFKKSEYYAIGLNVLLTSAYIWYLFRTLLKSPGHVFLSGGGDGSKNYFTYLYHVLNGKGWHFDGMNYPWGDHISFTDNQPLLAFPLSYLQSSFHFSLNDLLSIMNLLIPITLLCTSLVLCTFFIRMQVNGYLSALFSLLITFLAPNFYRIFGHFGLCYTFHLVLTLYWLFQFEARSRKRYLMGMLILNFLMAFLHMYHLLLGMLVIAFYAVAHLVLANKTLQSKLKCSLSLLGIVAVSFILVKLVFIATDAIPDRPKEPWGILHYITTFSHVFTSDYSQLGRVFSLVFNGFVATNLDEAYSYMGLIPLLYVIFILLNGILYFFRKRANTFYHEITLPEKYLLIIALLSFLFSIGFPFVHGFSFLLDYMPAIKQFRSLGRISLITYFCVSMACVLRISAILADLKVKNLQAIAFYGLFTVLLFWTLEIFGYSKYVQKRVDESASNYQNFFHTTEPYQDMPICTDTNYQCILGMPFYCIGSEKVGKDVDSEFSGDLFYLALQKRLPIVNTLMSRSSWKQSFQLMRLIGGPFADKWYFSKALNHQKILMVQLKEAYLTSEEQYLLSHSQRVGEWGRLVLYDLNWQQLLQFEESYVDSLNTVPIESFAANGMGTIAIGFDDKESDVKFFGKGAFEIAGADSVVLLNQTLNRPGDTKYEFSVWTLIPTHSYHMPYCTVDFYDSLNQVVFHKDIHAQNSNDNMNHWFRVYSELNIEARVRRIKVVLRNEDGHPATFVDELLLKPLDAFIVKEDISNATRMYQNHFIKRK